MNALQAQHEHYKQVRARIDAAGNEYLRRRLAAEIRETKIIQRQVAKTRGNSPDDYAATIDAVAAAADIIARQTLAPTIPLLPQRQITRVAIATAAYFNTTIDALKSENRRSHLVRPRHIAMYLARVDHGYSFPITARYFGRIDHTSAVHAVQKIAKSMDEYAADIAAVRGLVKAGVER